MSEIPSEPCKRHKAVVFGENIYLIIGDNFVMSKVPYENRPESHKLRVSSDEMCNVITKSMGGSND
jgi:hypothetical protein